jgi:environmental stress-induced protein Ves
MNHVLAAHTRPQPWRNGGGSTRELLTWPAGEAWALRISLAGVTQDGPFSAWPGVQRWFAVVEGAGVELALPTGPVALRPGSPPLHFAGDAAPHCRLLDGPTQDLNLMVRRGRGEMRRAMPASGAPTGTPWRALYTADAATLELDGAVMPLPAGTLAWLHSDEPVGWQLQDEAVRAWWLTWSPD